MPDKKENDKIDPKKKKDDPETKGVSKDLDLEPELSEERQPLSVQQRKQKGRVMRRYAKKIARSRERKMNRKATPDQLANRAKRQAINSVRNKVAGDKGSSYSDLAPSEKSMIDKKVAKRSAIVQRLSKRLLPSVRKMDSERIKSKRSAKNESFENIFEASKADTKPKKRFHELMSKDGKVKHDKRFRFNKKAPVSESMETIRNKQKSEQERLKAQQERERDRARTRQMRKKIRTINTENMSNDDVYNIIESMHVSIEDFKIMESLENKANESNHLLEVIEEVFDRGIDTYSTAQTSLTENQYAMNRVNSFIREGAAYDIDSDLMEDSVMLDKALGAVARQVAQGISIIDATWAVSRARGVNQSSKELSLAYAKKYGDPDLKISSSEKTKALYKKYGFNMREELSPEYMDEGLKDILNKLRGIDEKDIIDSISKMNTNQLQRIALMAGEKSAKRVLSPKDYLMWDAAKKKLAESKDDPCWKSHKMVGTKKKNGKSVPNCVPVNEAFESLFSEMCDGKGGAGEDGTTKLMKKYRKDTPKQEEVKEGMTFDKAASLAPKGKFTLILSKDGDIIPMDQSHGEKMRSQGWKLIGHVNPDGSVSKPKSIKESSEDYDIYHKTFSAAVQHAIRVVEKRGYEIDYEDWDRKVALGPRKPSAGKTNRYIIELTKNGKPTKPARRLHMQVYYDEGRYELNMYID